MKCSPNFRQKPGKKPVITFLIVSLLGISVCIAAGVLDYFGPPPPGDPSAFTGPLIDSPFVDIDLAALPPANEGTFENPAGTGSEEDTGLNNSVQLNQLQLTDVPTGGKPSPLFGAQPFTQKMLRFQEFGTWRYDPENLPAPIATFPLPALGPSPAQDPTDIAKSGPNGQEIGDFLMEPGLEPLASEFANEVNENPWAPIIEDFLGRTLDTPPADARPPGRGWAHQRWNEFFPQAYFKTSLAGARVNLGHRDKWQRHHFNVGEWAPDGLYYNVYESSVPGSPVLDGTTNGLGIRFHPSMPVQDHNTLWTFDGTLPPKLLMARVGQPILMRNHNMLPIDPSANRGFGVHTISTHEHNGHSPAESDGYTNAFSFPGQYTDYRWPLQLAGYDTINTDATDPRASFPCSPGETLFVNDSSQEIKTCVDGKIQIRGDWRETMSTHWFHDHMLDYTAQNVYKGNAVMMNYYSGLDRGNEEFDDGVNLRFPSGTALDWGNRDYDVNLVIAEKAWDQEGQLWFNIFNKDGFIGDVMTVNWLYKPYFEVRARSYRFRILNGSVSRYFALALVRERQGNGGEFPGPEGSGVSYDRVPFHMIGNDGNIMEHAVPFDGSMDLDGDGELQDHNGQLPTQSIAERYDIIVDFDANGIQPGDKIYFVNRLEHPNGKVTGDKIPLEDILSEKYLPETRDLDGDNILDDWHGGDPCVGKFFELRVVDYTGNDQSMKPSDYEPGKQKMIPLKLDRDNPDDMAKLADVPHRSFTFGRSNGTDSKPWTIKTDGGTGFSMDPRRVSAAPRLSTGPTLGGTPDSEGTWEVWSIQNGGQGWSHPVHVHFEEGIILRRGGNPPPEWEKWARKDMYRIGPLDDSTASVEMAIQFREFAGSYMEHCHNTQHEDNAMLLRFDIEHPGQLKLIPAPIPTWDGVEYVDSAALPTFRTGDSTGPTGTVNEVTLFESLGNNPDEFTFIANALSGAAPYEYRFWLNDPVTGWKVMQGYSNNNTWPFNTNGLAPGTYFVQVDARSAGSTAEREAFAVLSHVIVSNAVNVLAPNGGEVLNSGGLFNVEWNPASGAVKYRLHYFDADNTPHSVAEVGNVTSYAWTVPTVNVEETGKRFRVTAFDIDGNKLGLDFSDATFSILPDPAVVNVLAPNGGEVLNSGDLFNVEWNPASGAVKYRLHYFDADNTPHSVAEVGNVTSYAWTVPTVNIEETGKRFRVTAFDIDGNKLGLDFSDATFSILPDPAVVNVLAPNGGEVLNSGDLFNVEWNPASGAVKYRLHYFDADNTPHSVAEVGNVTSYAWTVPTVNVEETGKRFRVTAFDGGEAKIGFDFSDVPFTIQPTTVP